MVVASRGRFMFFQPNTMDSRNKYSDCAVRCLCKAEGVSWIRAYEFLCGIGKQLQAMPNSKVTYERALKQLGYTYHKISNAKGSKRPTVDSFTNEHSDGVYVLVVANHYVCCREGYYWDTWNSGNKCLYGYWEKKR